MNADCKQCQKCECYFFIDKDDERSICYRCEKVYTINKELKDLVRMLLGELPDTECQRCKNVKKQDEMETNITCKDCADKMDSQLDQMMKNEY